ncbi:hypothetical protein [Nakamurella deserti]|uniref:hypothetical protein n=1 Tax=Nakamurella deserti TaxID=2164074 RepID=UPI001300A61A|nr:hypothetical protein [Nakamurella deserti]
MTDPPVLPVSPGLCGSCLLAVVRPTTRGTVYLRCTAPGLPKYPDLPVRRCPEFRPA